VSSPCGRPEAGRALAPQSAALGPTAGQAEPVRARRRGSPSSQKGSGRRSHRISPCASSTPCACAAFLGRCRVSRPGAYMRDGGPGADPATLSGDPASHLGAECRRFESSRPDRVFRPNLPGLRGPPGGSSSGDSGSCSTGAANRRSGMGWGRGLASSDGAAVELAAGQTAWSVAGGWDSKARRSIALRRYPGARWL
jgi:hypothetical protein